MFRRPPPFQQKKPNLSNVDDEGEESDDSLPFANPSKIPGQREDPSATLRDTQVEQSRARSGIAGGARPGRENPNQEKAPPEPSAKGKGKQPVPAPKMESSASSASSAPTGEVTGQHKRLDALSPRHRAELARLSPRNRGNKKGPDGSDGTPSMGSSFSDLDGKFIVI